MSSKKKSRAEVSSGSSHSESGSDSEREEKRPAPKKAKTSSSESGLKVDDAEEPTWAIDKMRRVVVREFKGKAYVDIREYYEKDGKSMPGKKGISMTPEQYRKLKLVMPEVDEALKNI